MTKEEIRLLVNEGFALDQQKKVIEGKLESIKSRLNQQANWKKIEFAGEGCKAVIGTGAKLILQLDEATELKARAITGKYFPALFKWAPVAKFGDVLKAIFGEGTEANKLLKLLEGTEYQSCSFKRVEPAGVLPANLGS